MWFEILILLQHFIITGCTGYAILYYVRLKYHLKYYIKECDELIEQMVKDEPEPMTDKSLDKHRERLAALAAGGKCSKYFRENNTIEKIDNITDEKIKKLNEEITPIATQTQQIVNEEIPAIAPQPQKQKQARITKNPRKIAAGRMGWLARKAKRMHNSNSRPMKTWALVGVVAIAAVWLFYKTREEKKRHSRLHNKFN